MLKTRELFKAIWTDPVAFEPSRLSARVTRSVADLLVKIAKPTKAKVNKQP